MQESGVPRLVRQLPASVTGFSRHSRVSGVLWSPNSATGHRSIGSEEKGVGAPRTRSASIATLAGVGKSGWFDSSGSNTAVWICERAKWRRVTLSWIQAVTVK